LNAPALEISSAVTTKDKMPSIFVGIVDNDYTEAHWQDHRDRIKNLFEITNDAYGEIKVRNRGNQTVDRKQLTHEMQRALEIINAQHFIQMHIIRMGIGSSVAVDEALESLIRGWNFPPADKRIDFVALGESFEEDNLKFCNMLCSKKLCKKVYYFNIVIKDYLTSYFLKKTIRMDK
jgi:hypothetical protein